jgi:hypothetical protein
MSFFGWRFQHATGISAQLLRRVAHSSSLVGLLSRLSRFALARCTRILRAAPLILITQCNRNANCDILTVKKGGKDGAL